MNKLKQYFPLAIVFWGAVNLSQISLAQYWVPIQPPAPDMCGYREAPCRRDSDGNIVDRKSGDVYDRKGNLIQRGNRGSIAPTPTPSRTYRLDSKDLFTFTNQEDPKLATGQYANFGGTFSGKYTLPFWASLGIPIKGTLNLTQNGNQVAGTLVTGTDREAVLQGVVQGSQLVGKLIFNDSCAGEGSMIGDLSPTGDLMTGKYKVSDCNGKYSGRYKLKRL